MTKGWTWLVVAGLALAGCGDDGATAGADAADTAAPGADTEADAGDEGGPGDDAAGADAEPDAAPAGSLAFPVTEAGPFGVGYRVWEVTYEGPRGARTVPVHAWYPTEATTGTHPRYIKLFPDAVSLEDAPAADPVDAGYPVYVYSHGDQGFAGTGAGVARRLASHGWVVVAPDHVGNMLTANPDGELVAHFIERPLDLVACLDALEALPAEDPLARADTARVLAGGHSRGTYTAWALAGATFDVEGIAGATADEKAAFAAGFRDPRVVAAVTLAGTIREAYFGATGHASVTLPVLLESGTLDNPDAAQAMFDKATAAGLDFTWVEVEGGCHETFGLGLCETVDPEEGFAIAGTYVLAFGRTHVLGDAGARTAGVLDGTVEVSPLAAVQVAP